MKRVRCFVVCFLVLGFPICALGDNNTRRQDDALREKAESTLSKATSYFHGNLSVEGGYVYFYSLDTGVRWGEGQASAKQVWVQPPGSPTVGLALLAAYEATGNPDYLYQAMDAADALVYGQLSSGGWQNQIDLGGIEKGNRYSGGKRRKEGFSSLDDGQSQTAIRFMIRMDKALRFRDEEVHQSALLALDSLLNAQFPIGAFPQGWRGPVEKHAVKKASYPNYDWKTENRVKNYWDMYTLNDNVCGHVADTLVTAYNVYREEKYLKALKKLGDFLVLAQMPEPQPGWAQQYNYEMNPIWARKFEPAAVAGDESQEVIETLLAIYQSTGDKKYLQPIPPALAYLKRSLLKNGQLARYYELKTNRPLYMERKGKVYSLTYDDSRLPAHYGWKWNSRIQQLESSYESHLEGKASAPHKVSYKKVREIIESLDSNGRWVTVHDGRKLVGQAKMKVGERYVSSKRFSQNVETLATYLKQIR